MRVYLKLIHDLPVRQPRPDEFVGPFKNDQEAWPHQYYYGPADAVVVEVEGMPEGEVYSPEEHIAYLKEREELM